MPKSNDPPRRLHPLSPPSSRDVSWQRRQWRRYLDTTIDTIAKHLSPPVHTSRPQPSSSASPPAVRLTDSASPNSPSLPSLPSLPNAVSSAAPSSAPNTSVHPSETRAETIARLTPQESLFDRSIAERRRQRRERPSSSRLRASTTSQPTDAPRAQRSIAQSRPPQPLPTLSSRNVTPLRREVSVPSVQGLGSPARLRQWPSSRPDAHSQRPNQRPQRRLPLHPLVYGVRLVVLGVGLSAIAGTVLSVLSPTPQTPSTTAIKPETDTAEPDVLPVAFQRTQEIATLRQQMQALAARYPDFLLGVSLVDVDTGAFVNLNGDRALAAASTIKLPVLVAFFQAVDRGEVHLDEVLTLKAEQVAQESGTMQYDATGTQYSALEVATQMIVVSDNTATNMIIDRLGGSAALNGQFQSWGMTQTVLNAPLPDLQGTNTVSPDDLTHLLASIDRGELVSLRSRDRLLDILEATQNDSLLPQALGTGATIAHKTGNIKHSLGDTGLIDLPNGKRYVLSAIVKRPEEDDRAAEIVRQVSQLAHDYFAGAGSEVTPAGNPELPETQQARRPLDRPDP